MELNGYGQLDFIRHTGIRGGNRENGQEEGNTLLVGAVNHGAKLREEVGFSSTRESYAKNGMIPGKQVDLFRSNSANGQLISARAHRENLV